LFFFFVLSSVQIFSAFSPQTPSGFRGVQINSEKSLEPRHGCPSAHISEFISSDSIGRIFVKFDPGDF
jgi:hypothetical protein